MNQSASVRARTAHRRSGERVLGSPASPAPRRVSGPVPRPVAAGAGAGVRSGAAALPAGRPRRGGTSAFGRISGLPDHRFVDGLLRSQAWIWLIGIALGGIVAMQVSLLKLNSGIGRAVESASTLERQNAALELRVARLSSGERLERVAARAGMVMPAAGSVEYVRVRPGTDPRWAVTRMGPPTAAARALMANGGIMPGSLLPTQEPPATATAPVAGAAPETTATTQAPAANSQAPTAPSVTTAPQAPATTAPQAPATTAPPAPATTAPPASTDSAPTADVGAVQPPEG